jgi:hypothetical protein
MADLAVIRAQQFPLGGLVTRPAVQWLTRIQWEWMSPRRGNPIDECRGIFVSVIFWTYLSDRPVERPHSQVDVSARLKKRGTQDEDLFVSTSPARGA